MTYKFILYPAILLYVTLGLDVNPIAFLLGMAIGEVMLYLMERYGNKEDE